VSLRKNSENAERSIQVARTVTYQYIIAPFRNQDTIDNLFDLEVFPSKMFRNFIQTLLDILELVLDPAHVL
jgi:hypothetical protein